MLPDASPPSPGERSSGRRPVPHAAYAVLAFVMAAVQVTQLFRKDGSIRLWYLAYAFFCVGAGVYLIVQGRRVARR